MIKTLNTVVDITVNQYNLVHELDNSFHTIEEAGRVVTQFILNEKTYENLKQHKDAFAAFFKPDGGDEVMFWSALVYVSNKVPDNKIILVGEKLP